MQVVLVMFRAEGDKRSFSITKDVTVIGRREDCDLRIPVSEVSRKHCRVLKDGDAVRVEDLGSSNGTYHNGQRISGSVTLEPGDSVQVGPVVFVLQIDGSPPEEELAPFEQRAAQHLDDSLAPSPTAGGEGEAADEGLEMLDDSAAPTGTAAAGEAEPLSLADDSQAPATAGHEEPLSLENADSGEHAARPGALSEDELLLDLNAPEETHEKH
jgi:pSer/pThr/pTyr-binding forkhead associated (FHA) protein